MEGALYGVSLNSMALALGAGQVVVLLGLVILCGFFNETMAAICSIKSVERCLCSMSTAYGAHW